MGVSQQIGGKGNRKKGRDKVKCERYKNAHKREKNRDKRMKKKLKELNKNAKSRVLYEIKRKKVGTSEIINIIKVITPEEVKKSE